MTNELTLDDLPQPVEETTVHPDDLHVDGDNPNEQSEEMFGLLCDNLRAKGWLGNAIVADVDGCIADGEHRWRAAQEIGLEEVPVKFYEIDEPERRLWRQELNKISGEHDTKRDALEYDYLLNEGMAEDVQDLVDATDEDLDELLAEIRVDKSKRPAYEYTPSTEVHFEDAVEGIDDRVDDDSVDLVLTDPPYGVDIDLTETLGASDVKHAGSLENDGYEEAVGLWRAIVPELKRVLAPTGHLYAFASWKTYDDFRDVLEDAGFEVLNCIIWLKSTPNNQTTFGSGGVRYGYQHEFILYAVHDTSDARPLDRTMSDIILHKHSSQDNEHPTEKPVGLLETLLEQSTEPGDLVLDPFMGSGSTAVAAIQNERDCIGFEIDAETYRPVIERRIGEAKRAREASVNQTPEA
ncbi:DNA methyltransferase [Salinilacihabitans rarus]|uniref:DNA methyltransferase n=1 Tax=Salinilacihabitans rarus TaxID=2961596 RepID=UPI0020C85F8C|nr:DNA methyltransferase [Salinilacihabitans rarus]